MYNKSKANVSKFELGFVLFCHSVAKEIVLPAIFLLIVCLLLTLRVTRPFIVSQTMECLEIHHTITLHSGGSPRASPCIPGHKGGLTCPCMTVDGVHPLTCPGNNGHHWTIKLY